MCMRTNIELNDDLVAEASRYSLSITKKGLIEEALRTFIAVEDEKRRLQSYASRLEQARSKVSGLVLRERPMDVLRADRSRR